MTSEPFEHCAVNRDISAVPIHDQDAPKAGSRDAIEHVGHESAHGRDAQRDRPRILDKIRRQAIGDHGKYRDSQRLGRLRGDTSRQDRIHRQAQIRMLLGRTDRKHGAIVVRNMVANLHPVHVGDLHERSVISSKRNYVDHRAMACQVPPGTIVG
jgi:hypothetical protein